jgi:CRISPR-associated protein Cmr3
MEAGLPVSSALFPPLPSVIIGAVLTASGRDYWKPELRDQARVYAVLLKRRDEYYAQAPYSWFEDKTRHEKTDKTVFYARDNSAEFENEPAVASSWPLPWIDCVEAKSLGGSWIPLRDFSGNPKTVKPATDLYDTENRIGVGLDANRAAIEGQLYSAQHIRLRDGVSIIVGIDQQYGLADKGLLQLGGENRRCAYRKIAGPALDMNSPAAHFVALAPVLCTKDLLDKTFCAKTFISAGWDMAKGKKGDHKDSQTWFFAGSVFTENINGQCLPLHENNG